jgi:hypothetical protein
MDTVARPHYSSKKNVIRATSPARLSGEMVRYLVLHHMKSLLLIRLNQFCASYPDLEASRPAIIQELLEDLQRELHSPQWRKSSTCATRIKPCSKIKMKGGKGHG